jgi:uncharacterized membrane protein (UPF0127 family)
MPASRLALAVLGMLLGAAASGGAAGPEMNPPLPTATASIAGRTTVTVELARTPQEKGRGLSNRSGLAEGNGMAFVYEVPQSIGIWMKDMRFPLDILWARDGRIVKIERGAPPLRPGDAERVYTAIGDLVLEVPAGFVDRAGIRLGDSVKLRTQ